MTQKQKKYIIEGKYVAEVEIELIKSEEAWSPYLSMKDAKKLDIVREALKKQDIQTAQRYGRVYTLSPVAA